MSIKVFNKSIKLINNDNLRITKQFAELNLSPACLKCADNVTDKYYEWDWNMTSFMVVYELPTVFEVDFHEFSQYLNFYCEEYIALRHLTAENVVSVFDENCKKKIIFSPEKE